MEQLSDQELCEIFAKIPFSKSKVSLQAVSARWRRVVTMPQSHSFSTFSDDQDITVEEPILCPAVLMALPGVKLEGGGRLLLRLPLNLARLQGLRLSCPPGGHCPTLPRLQFLQLSNPWGQHSTCSSISCSARGSHWGAWMFFKHAMACRAGDAVTYAHTACCASLL